ncbi:MAG: FAD-binding oxidoreductase, partial [Oscillatoriales cyanobacterium SM2_1_8]|nr:FAD-binding oxidoreductase [Oscillatoriales cyanobacterium SM2_1_8]
RGDRGGTWAFCWGRPWCRRGWRVLVCEAGALQGRIQEWNLSRGELQRFLALGLLTAAEAETVVATEYERGRVRFHGGIDLWVTDVLNLGVSPARLLALLKQKFLDGGGILQEGSPFGGATVHRRSVTVQVGTETTTARLLVDAMGHFSPIARQARQGDRPDSVCLVMGGCAQGLPAEPWGDVLATIAPIEDGLQYFWEAFPAQDGRTTYLFTYADTHPDRPTFAQLWQRYAATMPAYQAADPEAIAMKRVLFGFFPSYRRSPLTYPWGRVLAIGDSSGQQSPLSFGGFGAMARHLPRLVMGVDELLRADALTAADLGWVQPYQPGLASTWLFNRTMTVPPQAPWPPQRVNATLSAAFAALAQGGDRRLQPFLQDVVQFGPLTATMATMAWQNPAIVAQAIQQVGALDLGRWFGHYLALGSYSLLDRLSDRLPAFREPTNLYGHLWQAAWRYGSGRDALTPIGHNVEGNEL